MRRIAVIAGGVLVVLAAGLFAWTTFLLNETRTYPVEGRIRGFGTDGQSVFVEHEAIQNYMPAMTMRFEVPDTADLSGFEIGDAVGFSLHVSADSARIAGLRQLPDTAVAQNPAGASRPASDASEILREGERVPDFSFVTQEGDTTSFHALPGEVVLVTFVYTRCPLPTFCPLMSRRFAELQPRLRRAFGDSVHMLSISFDPAHDTPDVMREYAARYTDRLDTWTFATGDSLQIDRATDLFGVFPRPAGPVSAAHGDRDALQNTQDQQPGPGEQSSQGEQSSRGEQPSQGQQPSQGDIIHNLTTALVGPEHHLLEVWRGNDWSTDDVMREVERAL